MKIILAGGTGQVGTVLARALSAREHTVTVLSRRPTPMPWTVVPWDAKTVGDWKQHLEAADAVVNLAGRSVNCRYHTAKREAIIDSRVDSTRAIGEAIQLCAVPPRVWLQMSTATIYSHRYNAANEESTGIIGGDEPGVPETWRFSIEVAKAWEAAATQFALPATRQVLLRTAMVMSPDRGGVFDVLLGLVRRGLGGRQGDGRQYMSWIHEIDFVNAVLWLIDNDLSGPVNLASPGPLPNADFMRTLRQAWGRTRGLPATRWMLEIGTWLLRTETELILKSRRVVPTRLLQSGFAFQFPEWKSAVAELCQRWRSK